MIVEKVYQKSRWVNNQIEIESEFTITLDVGDFLWQCPCCDLNDPDACCTCEQTQ